MTQPPAGPTTPPPADPGPGATPPTPGSSAVGPRVRRSPRLLIGAGAGVLVLLVAGGVVVANRGGGTSTTAGGTPTPRPGVASSAAPTTGGGTAGNSLFGVSIPLGKPGTAQGIVQHIKQQFGTIPVARVYSETPPPASWNDDPTLAALGSGSAVVYTFKGDAAAAAAGQYDAQVTSFLKSRPAGLKVWFGFYHEPEDQVANGTFTAQQYRDATAHLAPVIDAAGGISTTILMAYDLQPGSKYSNWQEYYSPAVDVLGWDTYNTGVKKAVPIYKPVDKIMEPILAAAKLTGKPFGIGEFGSPCISSDPSCTGRAQWLAALGTAFQQDGAVFATYFDQKGVRGGPDYSLDDPSSSGAYRKLITAG